MKDILRVVNKVFVREFYRVNAGFFFLVIGLCFGFLRDVEHIALAQFFVSSPSLTLIPLAFWVMYAIKVIMFNRQEMRRPINAFLLDSVLFRSKIRWVSSAQVAASQFLPAFAYGLFLTLMAYKLHQLLTGSIVVVSLCFLWLLVTINLHKSLVTPFAGFETTFVKRWLDKKFRKPFAYFYLEWVTRNRPGELISIKLFGCLLLWSVAKLYNGEAYDIRLISMGVVIALSANALLLLTLQRFVNTHLLLVRNLPYTLSRRFIMFLQTLIILIFPELGILINYFPEGFSIIAIASAAVLGVSVPVFLYGYLYRKHILTETFVRSLFFFGIGWILLILFKIPILGIATINIVLGVVFFAKYFYSFEFRADLE